MSPAVYEENPVPPDDCPRAEASVSTPAELNVEVAVPPKYAVPKFESSVEEALVNVCRALQVFATELLTPLLIQVPFTAKHPPVILMPPANVLVLVVVETSRPVVKVPTLVASTKVVEPVICMLAKVAVPVAVMLVAVNVFAMVLPVRVVEAKDALEVLVRVPTVPEPMVAFPMAAILAVSVLNKPFRASRRPEK